MKNINLRWTVLALMVFCLVAMTIGAALAQTYEVTVVVDWNDNDPYDCEFAIDLRDQFNVILEGPVMLDPNAPFTVWTGEFVDPDAECVTYVLTWWTNSPPYDWGAEDDGQIIDDFEFDDIDVGPIILVEP